MTSPIALAHQDVVCALCGATAARPLLVSAGHKGRRLYRGEEPIAVAGTETLARCSHCGLVFVQPQPLLPEGLSTYPPSEEAAYFGARRTAHLAGASRLLDEIESQVPQRGRLLDIGCGDGAFLAVAQQRGWEVSGVEASATLVEGLSQGVLAGKVVLGRAESLLPTGPLFDVVLLLNVLEHLQTPRLALERVADLLRPGGLLAVHVPNYAWGKLWGTRWGQLEPLDHLYYFTPCTLRALLNRVGLRPMQRFALPGISPWKTLAQRVLNWLNLWPGSGLGILALKPLQQTTEAPSCP